MTKQELSARNKIRDELIVRLQRAGLKHSQIGPQVGLSPSGVGAVLHKHGISSVRYGPAHHHWAGGRKRTSEGYIRVKVSPTKYVLEHILVAEQALGRPLHPDEVVHHKNGIKWDNRLENLEVMSRSAHFSLHRSGKWTNEELLERLRACAQQLGRTPTKVQLNQFRKAGECYVAFYHDRFGSYTAACRAAGLKPNPGGPRRKP